MTEEDSPSARPRESHGSVETPLGESGSGVPRQSPSHSSLLRRIFIGPNGLRAGWRLLIFFLIFLAYSYALVGTTKILLRKSPEGATPTAILFREGLSFLAVLLSALTMGRFEKQDMSQYALPLRGAFGGQFWRGVVWGFFALSLLLLILRLRGNFYFGGLALRGRELVTYAFLWAIAFLCVGFFEEFLIRGYTLYTLATGMGFWPAAVLLSVLFGAVHLKNPGENMLGGLNATLIGLFFCLTLRRTGSLWFAIGMHAMWDYSESFLYSVPDSGIMVSGHLVNSSFRGPAWLTGGPVGPEGSVLALVMIVVMWIVFDRMHPNTRFQATTVPRPPAIGTEQQAGDPSLPGDSKWN